VELYELLKVAIGDTQTSCFWMIFRPGREDRNRNKCVDSWINKKI